MSPAPEAPRTGRRWPAVLGAAASIAVMGGVVALALGRHAGARGPGTGAPEAPPRGTPAPLPAGGDLSGCTSVDPERPPRLVFELSNGRFDFGSVKQGEQRTAEVRFRNAGRGLLCVTRVGTGCGCLKARLKNLGKHRFHPAEHGTVLLKLDTTGREGRIEKTVSVTSNDLAAPIRSFKVRFDISRAVVASPPALSFGQRPRRTPVDASLLLKSPRADDPWTVTSVTGTRRDAHGHYVAYTFDTEPVPDPRFRVLRLTVHHPGLDAPGPFRDGLVIRTTHPDRPELLVQAWLTVVERIRAVPRRVSLGFVRPGAPPRSRRFLLRPGGPEVRFEATGVTVEPLPGRPAPGGAHGGFETTVGTQDGVAFVDVRYDGRSRRPGLVEAVLVVHTTDPQMPEVRVPVSATVRPR